MVRAKSRKLPPRPPDTAAYAASQPLFDELRNGCERVDEQRLQLSVARDLVQQLHVKLPHVIEDDETIKHQRYMSCAVRAYVSAMDSYANIFEALAAVTAADLTEGREQRDGHEVFASMAHTAAAARAAGLAFVSPVSLDDLPSQSPPARKRGLSIPAADEVEDVQPASKVRKLSERIKDGHSGEKKHFDEGADTQNGLQSGMSDSRRKASQQEKLRQKREKTLQAKSDKQGQSARFLDDQKTWGQSGLASQDGGVNHTSEQNVEPSVSAFNTGADSVSFSEPAQHKEPGVEYEDVSAEVEARLKAKEDKRRAKQIEKKRKRASDQSVPGVEVDAKQQKKKSRHANEVNNSVGGAQRAEKVEEGKRRNSSQGAKSARMKKKRSK